MHARTGTATVTALCLTLLAAAPAAAAAAPSAPLSSPLVDGVSTDERSLVVREVPGPASRLRDLAPGDSVVWAAEVTNASASGTPVLVDLDAGGDRPLVGDPRDGLQLDVVQCDTGYAAVADGPLSCRGAVVRLGSGPAATLGRLGTSIPLAAGDSTSVGVRVSFPASAGNDAESTAASLRVTFSLVDPAGPGPVDPDPVDPDPVDPAPQPGGPSAPGGGSGAPADGAGTQPATADDDPRRGPLPVTGRDIASALSGGLLTLAVGAILLLASRRRRPAAPPGSPIPPEAAP
jgi:hypothetical protein